MAGGGLPMAGGKPGQKSADWCGSGYTPAGTPSDTSNANATTGAVNPNPNSNTKQAPEFVQNALQAMRNMYGLPAQQNPYGAQLQGPSSLGPQPWMQQQPSWMPQWQQAQQTFQQSDAFRDYQNKMQALQNDFQNSDTFKNFQQQQQSFQPQIQEWQQQQMQRQFPPMYGGFPGRGYGRGFGRGYGGGLAELLGGFGGYGGLPPGAID